MKFWDLLFKRYASPFSFIEGMLESDSFDDAIRHIIDAENDEKLWQIYLHSNPYIAPRKSFNDFKKDVTGNVDYSKPLTENEIKVAVSKSQNILNNFHID